MLFDYFRRSRSTPLALLFAFAANAPLPPQTLPPQNQELRQLAREYALKGPLMTRARFERFTDLMATSKDSNVSAIAGLCGGHGSSGNGSTTTGPMAATGRRRKEDDSCLLSFHYWV